MVNCEILFFNLQLCVQLADWTIEWNGFLDCSINEQTLKNSRKITELVQKKNQNFEWNSTKGIIGKDKLKIKLLEKNVWDCERDYIITKKWPKIKIH